MAFSPSGRHFAVGIGHLVEVWQTPFTPDSTSEDGLEFAPFIRHRVYAGHYDTVRGLEWSSDSRFFLSAAKDLTARIWSLDPVEGFVPTTLAGHREGLLGAWFSNDQEAVHCTEVLDMRALAYMINRYTPPARTVLCSNGSIVKNH